GIVVGLVNDEPCDFSGIYVLELNQDVVRIRFGIADRLPTGKAGQHRLDWHWLKCSLSQKGSASQVFNLSRRPRYTFATDHRVFRLIACVRVHFIVEFLRGGRIWLAQATRQQRMPSMPFSVTRRVANLNPVASRQSVMGSGFCRCGTKNDW